MKKYEKPEIQVSTFTNEDVITASGGLNLYASGKMSQGENVIDY